MSSWMWISFWASVAPLDDWDRAGKDDDNHPEELGQSSVLRCVLVLYLRLMDYIHTGVHSPPCFASPWWYY